MRGQAMRPPLTKFDVWNARRRWHKRQISGIPHVPPTALRLNYIIFAEGATSAIGTKRTRASALHMSAFGGKADIAFCTAHVCF